MLHIPEEERSQCEGELKQPRRVFVKAVRVTKRMDTNGRNVSVKGNMSDVEGGGLYAFFTQRNVAKVEVNAPKEEEKENVREKVSEDGTPWCYALVTDLYAR